MRDHLLGQTETLHQIIQSDIDKKINQKKEKRFKPVSRVRLYILVLKRTSLTRSRSYQTFSLRKRIIFLFFAVKLGHFIVNTSFSHVTNTQALLRKSENKEKQSLVGSTPVQCFLKIA